MGSRGQSRLADIASTSAWSTVRCSLCWRACFSTSSRRVKSSAGAGRGVLFPEYERATRMALSAAERVTMWWALALGSDLGGNATAVGASANVVIIGIAARNGARDGRIHHNAVHHLLADGIHVQVATARVVVDGNVEPGFVVGFVLLKRGEAEAARRVVDGPVFGDVAEGALGARLVEADLGLDDGHPEALEDVDVPAERPGEMGQGR